MKEPIYSRPDGTYVIEHNGYPYHVIESDPLFAEVQAYLLDHPEALVPEPVPPPPTGEELAARRVAEARTYLASTDWVIAKLGEAQMLGGDIATLVEKYQDVLDARVEARDTINEGEA